jgi:hypothetical protein
MLNDRQHAAIYIDNMVLFSPTQLFLKINLDAVELPHRRPASQTIWRAPMAASVAAAEAAVVAGS